MYCAVRHIGILVVGGGGGAVGGGEGIHVTKWLGALSLSLFLAPHQEGFFRISRFIPDGICSHIAQYLVIWSRGFSTLYL